MFMLVPCAPAIAHAEGADAEDARAGRDAEQALVRADRARHAGAVRMRRLVVRGQRVEGAGDDAREVGMLAVDFRIDHRDLHVLAGRDAVRLDEAELGDDVLRRVALVRGPAAALVEQEGVARLRRDGGAARSAARRSPRAPRGRRRCGSDRPCGRAGSNVCCAMTSSPYWRASAGDLLRRQVRGRAASPLRCGRSASR